MTGADRLSLRERQVLSCLARGLDDKTTAAELGMSVSTMRSHLRNAMRTLGANTRSHAMVLFRSRAPSRVSH
jgi:DNA-binding CsgD family transcriptional regulator